MRFLVDTNVFLNVLLKRENYQTSKDFFKLCKELKHQLYVTSMSIRDIGYVVHSSTHDKEIAKLAQIQTYQMVRSIIDINADDTINSLYGDFNDFEDSLIAESAERNFLDAIVTDNIKDYKNSKVAVFTPNELVSIFTGIN